MKKKPLKEKQRNIITVRLTDGEMKAVRAVAKRNKCSLAKVLLNVDKLVDL